MATWALDCAERVLPTFEAVDPIDLRPRRAIETGRVWVSTGQISVAVIRKASLDAHSAAKEIIDPAAIAAARVAGQAVATAPLPTCRNTHMGCLLCTPRYRCTIAGPECGRHVRGASVAGRPAPGSSARRIMDRIVVEEGRRGLRVSVRKGAGF